MEDPVSRHARERPDALALRAGGRELTYAELHTQVERVAQELAEDGVGPSSRLITALPAGIDFAVLLHAAPRVGAALVPLAPGLPAAERRRLEAAARAGSLLEGTPRRAGGSRGADPSTVLDAEATHTVLFTSGSTARPKAVELTYANHFASARASADNLGVDPTDRWLCALPVNHVGGLAILLRSALYGTAAVVHERFEAAAIRDSLAAGETTLMSLVPTQLRRLAEAGLEAAPRLRAALIGGGPVPVDLLAWAADRGLPFLQTYGMTETASQIATLPAAEALSPRRRGSAGRPLAGVELRVDGEEREILARGPMVSRSALAPDGWLHTGDRGSLDRDGYLWVDGRLDDTIVTGGENVSALEVEDVLSAHPAVAEAAVVGRPDPEWGEAVVAHIVLADGVPEPRETDLVDHCRLTLAAHKAPKEIYRVADLPRTASGKVARARLRSDSARRARGG